MEGKKVLEYFTWVCLVFLNCLDFLIFWNAAFGENWTCNREIEEQRNWFLIVVQAWKFACRSLRWPDFCLLIADSAKKKLLQLGCFLLSVVLRIVIFIFSQLCGFIFFFLVNVYWLTSSQIMIHKTSLATDQHI